jgi:hypothetical protein
MRGVGLSPTERMSATSATCCARGLVARCRPPGVLTLPADGGLLAGAVRTKAAPRLPPQRRAARRGQQTCGQRRGARVGKSVASPITLADIHADTPRPVRAGSARAPPGHSAACHRWPGPAGAGSHQQGADRLHARALQRATTPLPRALTCERVPQVFAIWRNNSIFPTDWCAWIEREVFGDGAPAPYVPPPGPPAPQLPFYGGPPPPPAAGGFGTAVPPHLLPPPGPFPPMPPPPQQQQQQQPMPFGAPPPGPYYAAPQQQMPLGAQLPGPFAHATPPMPPVAFHPHPVPAGGPFGAPPLPQHQPHHPPHASAQPPAPAEAGPGPSAHSNPSAHHDAAAAGPTASVSQGKTASSAHPTDVTHLPPAYVAMLSTVRPAHARACVHRDEEGLWPDDLILAEAAQSVHSAQPGKSSAGHSARARHSNRFRARLASGTHARLDNSHRCLAHTLRRVHLAVGPLL